MDGELLISTKKDGGIGLQSVKAVVERYGEMIRLKHDDERFYVFVLWKINE